MDGTRFDEMARRLAVRGSRRGFLSGGAALVAGLIGATSAAAACPPGQIQRRGLGCVCRSSGRPPEDEVCPCRSGQERCGDVCVSPRSAYRNDPANCGGCGVVCPNGICGNGACLECATAGDCASPADPCQVAACLGGTCANSPVACVTGEVCVAGGCQQCTATATITGELIEGADPVFTSCVAPFSFHYDTYGFVHCSGALTVRLRGDDSDGGTHRNPYLNLYAGEFDPSDCTNLLAHDNKGGCGFDALLSFADLPAGPYTAVMQTGVAPEAQFGSYTLEINQPEPPCSV